jgi:hypothetical protein
MGKMIGKLNGHGDEFVCVHAFWEYSICINYDGIRNYFMDNQVGGVLKSLAAFIFSIHSHSLTQYQYSCKDHYY